MLATQLHSPRLLLREIVHEDWRALHDCMLSSTFEFPFEEIPHEIPLSQLYVEQALFEQKRMPRRRFEFAILLKGSQQLIGACSLKIGYGVVREGDIGYILNKQFWKQGYAIEAAKILIEFAFRDLEIFRILATCTANNDRSINVLKKLGMAHIDTSNDKIQYAMVRPISFFN